MNVRGLVALAGVVALVACGDERTESRDTAAVSIKSADSIAAVTPFYSGHLVIENVVAPQPVPAGNGAPPVAVYFTVRNTGTRADTLVAIEVTAATATLHQQTGTGGGMETMVPLTFAVIPPGESIRFAPGGRHVMIEELTRPLAVGEVIPMTMIFARAGRAAVGARVITYGDLEHVLSGDEHAGH